MEKIHQWNGTRKQAGITIFLCKKINFILKWIRRAKEGLWILMKLIKKTYMHQALVNPTHKKYVLLDLKTQINIYPLIPYFLQQTGNMKKMNRETLELIDITHQINLTDTYRIFYWNTKEYIVYSAVYQSFPKVDHILWQKNKSL